MKTAVLVSCFDWYDNRIKPIKQSLENAGYKVNVLLSDFNHIEKCYIKKKNKECIYIHVIKYKRNLSLRRLLSHWIFARKVYQYFFNVEPDLIYALIPPNSVAAWCIRYKKKTKKSVKVIFDIIDLWPESMPLNFFKKTFPYVLWKNLRDRNIELSDHVFTECTMYQLELHSFLPQSYSTLYLFKNQTSDERNLVKDIIHKHRYNEDYIILGYVGSINNIIDISAIVKVVRLLSSEYSVEIRVIGDGEKKEEFLKTLRGVCKEVKYFGKIFNETEKIEILAPCDFALNIMKDTVKVGLTIKSIDYFSYGLPLINNIKGDTWYLIENYHLGINLGEKNFLSEVKSAKNKKNHEKVLSIYDKFFTKASFVNQLNKGIKDEEI